LHPFLHAPEASSGQAKMEQPTIKMLQQLIFNAYFTYAKKGCKDMRAKLSSLLYSRCESYMTKASNQSLVSLGLIMVM